MSPCTLFARMKVSDLKLVSGFTLMLWIRLGLPALDNHMVTRFPLVVLAYRSLNKCFHQMLSFVHNRCYSENRHGF